ncbi:MAG: penicillin-binding protein 2 [Thermodesulfobacteriaceae bacterium]|nr:penicillin-binding protein 2 [Thermodesulfobacteriaceae bacterium]MCX8042024.1 penicillin-binding protein 2 [Thermodesulfobacteriaceae bacterium]MDW8135363.1 penicillin-binding protein 2 [Thermodesulfobacterium sp.]
MIRWNNKNYKEVEKETILKTDFWPHRIYWVKILLGLLSLICIVKIVYLQTLKHPYYYKKAKERSVVNYILKAPRGQIYTADGVVVATSKAVFQLYLDIEIIKNREEELLYKLSKILREDFSVLKERYYLAKKSSLARVLLRRNLSWDEVAKLMVRLYYLPGVSIEVETERYYPYGEAYFHLLGYISKVTQEEYETLKDKGYSMEDYIGRGGLEWLFEKELKGKNGVIEIERDAFGRLGKVIGRSEPQAGNDLILSVRHDLQMFIYELVKEKRAGIIALSPESGEVLALVSTPSIDPNKFIEGFSKEEWEKVNLDPKKPFLNRVFQAYPPGSTYKVITALAGLKSGIIKDLNTSAYCPGYFPFGTRVFRCWEKRGHGGVNLLKAMAVSCDIFFYWISSKVEVNLLAEISREFGLGKPSGLGYPNEKAGLIPDRAWKKRVYQQEWYPGETVVLGIGQGYISTTPIQLAKVYMAIANGGLIYKPYIVKKIKKLDGTEVEFSPILEKKVEVDLTHLEWIREGLVKVVKEGTGKAAFVPEIFVAGKTGTAQVVSLAKKTKNLEHHAWFISYAGKEKPEIVSAILVEHGGSGGAVAAPLAGLIYRKFYNLFIPLPTLKEQETIEEIPLEEIYNETLYNHGER